MSHSMLGALRRQGPEHSPGFGFHLGYTARPFLEKIAKQSLFQTVSVDANTTGSYVGTFVSTQSASNPPQKKIFAFLLES